MEEGWWELFLNRSLQNDQFESISREDEFHCLECHQCIGPEGG